MTNNDPNELSTNELEAVSGGDYSFMPSAPSKQTVQTIGAVVGAVTGVVTGSALVVGANLLYGTGHVAGDGDAHNKS
jgi:bacteriocin-like protein